MTTEGKNKNKKVSGSVEIALEICVALTIFLLILCYDYQ